VEAKQKKWDIEASRREKKTYRNWEKSWV